VAFYDKLLYNEGVSQHTRQFLSGDDNMKNRQRLATLLAVALGLSLLLVLAWVLQVLAVEQHRTQTTLEEFNEGSLYLTALTNQEDGEVRLMTIGIAGDWITETNITNLPGLMEHCAVYHDGVIFVTGGRQRTSSATDDIYATTVDFETHDLADWWVEKTLPASAYPNGVTMHGCAVVYDRLYVIGGLDASAQVQDDVVYAAIGPGGSLGDWQTADSLPQPRYAPEVVAFDDRIYVLGGVYPGLPRGQIWYGEVNAGSGAVTWYTATATLPPMTAQYPGYYGHAVAASDDFIYVTGGTNLTGGSGYFSPRVYYTAPAVDGDIEAFTQTTDMSRNLFAHTAVAVNGQLFLLGGATNEVSTASDYVGAAILGQDGGIISGWVENSILVPARFWHASVVSIDSWIYVIGGSSGGINPLEANMINRGSITGEGAHDYADEGTFTSDIMEVDELYDRVLTGLSWDATISNTAAMSLSMEYRYRPEGEYWSVWEGPFPSSATPGRVTTTVDFLDYPLARLFQYRVTFQTTISQTPVLNAVTLHFDVPETPPLEKTADPPDETEVEPGDTIAYTLVYTNPNATPLTSFVITDFIPISTTLVLGSIYPEGYTIDPEGDWVKWELGTLEPFAIGEVGMTVRVRDDVPDGILIENGAQIDSRETMLGFSNVTRHPVNRVVYDLEVSKDDGLEGVSPGQLITYTILYTNTNEFALTLSDLVLTETLSAYPYVSHVAGSGPWVEVSPGVYTLQAGSLGPNASGSLEFAAQISPGIPPEIELFTNTVRIRGESLEGVDIERENNVAYDVDVILPLDYDLSVIKDDLTTTAEPGDTLFYSITLLNQNDLGLPVGGVVLTETLDPADYMSYTGGSPWVSVAPGVYRYELPDPLPAGTPLVIPFEVEVALDLPIEALLGITNTVEVAAEDFSGTDLDLDNNSFFDIDIVWGPDLAVTDFRLSPSRPVAGELLTMDVTVVNQGITKTGTTSPNGEGFFYVEVYAKDADFNPDGPPDGAMDHDGGFWGPLPGGTWGWRYDYINYFSPVAGLDPGEEIVVSFTITPSAVSPYDFYAQVDLTFDVPVSTTHPFGYPWGIHEEGNEYNNIVKYQAPDIPPVYLPIVMRN
jgi:uncharacterized repeat protein (TIGR01451 family)